MGRCRELCWATDGLSGEGGVWSNKILPKTFLLTGFHRNPIEIAGPSLHPIVDPANLGPRRLHREVREPHFPYKIVEHTKLPLKKSAHAVGGLTERQATAATASTSIFTLLCSARVGTTLRAGL